MTDKDREKFANILAATAEIYGEQLSELRGELFFNALKDYPIETIRDAFNIHVRQSVFFPKPADIIRIVENGTAEERARLIWGALIKCLENHAYWDSVEFPEEVGELIDQLFGGWIKLSELTYEGLKWAEKRFVEHLRMRLERGLSGKTKVLYGQHDIDNQRLGFSERQKPAKFSAYCPQLVLLKSKEKALGGKQSD